MTLLFQTEDGMDINPFARFITLGLQDDDLNY